MPSRASLRALCVASLVAFLVLHSTAAFADERTDFEKGRNAFLGKNYVEADARFGAMLDPMSGTLRSKELVADALMYWGATKFGLGKKDEAGALFEKVILSNPQYEPDPLNIPTAVLDAFTDTRIKLRDKLNEIAAQKARDAAVEKARLDALAKRQAEYVALLEKAASEEPITNENSRWIAMLPFGVGQFQNGRPMAGWLFLSTEASLLIGTGITFGMYRYDIGNATDALAANANTTQNDKILLYAAYIDRAKQTRWVNLGLVLGLAAEALAGIIEAQINYVPTLISVKKRPLPKLPDVPANDPSQKTETPRAWILPTASPLANVGEDGRIFFGGQIGVVGAF